VESIDVDYLRADYSLWDWMRRGPTGQEAEGQPHAQRHPQRRRSARAPPPTGALDRHANGFYSGRPMATSVNAHITGTVWKIEVKVGDTIAEGQTVVILESMKMEMPVESPFAGRVSAILVKESDSVEEGAPVVELQG